MTKCQFVNVGVSGLLKTKLNCESISDNHSTDKVQVWIGEETPWYLCGYHAYQINASLIEKIREAEISYTPCDECGELIEIDTHKEELGMCLECSHAYFTH
jgi:formylmethanofuran dehydrogenase subunit E